MAEALLRIGGLSEQTGVSPELLRAWERRYRLLRPLRTEGGFRLYSRADARRVVAMRALVKAGVPAREAALTVLADDQGVTLPESSAGGPLEELRKELHERLTSFDELAAQALLDDALARYDLDLVCTRVLIPELKRLGDDWEAGTLSVGQEHFASNLIRGRLLGLTRGWDRGSGPRALLACPPEQYHDISLIIFGLALSRWGWRITFLGAHTPITTVRDAARQLSPRLVVLFSPSEEHFTAVAAELRTLGQETELLLAGAGATDAIARRAGAGRLTADPAASAAVIAREG